MTLDYSSSGHKRQESKPIFTPVAVSASVLPTHVGNWSNARDYMDSQKLAFNVDSDDLFVSFEHGL